MIKNLRREERVILFTDIHDFSITWRELGDRGPTFLQEVYEGLGDVVVAHGGELLKYMGDGVLCLFPAGAEVEAVRCAVALRETFAKLVVANEVAHETELEVGISAGEVAMGTFGHRSLRLRDAFGEAVNQAAMIGHHRGIAVTVKIQRRIDGEFETRRLPDRQLKWQPEPLAVFEVIEGETANEARQR